MRKTPPHASRLRIGRVSEPGLVYLITTATQQRQAFFSDFSVARRVTRVLSECDAAGSSATLAFVLMPDHLHWLIELRANDLSSVVRRFKSVSARSVNVWRNTPGAQLWQPGFHDRALRREEDLIEVARYVIANPVRAGLVKSVRDYPHWDAVWL